MKKIISFILVFLFTTSFATAHRGRTDAQGGHYDKNNESGLGSYHYHHGYSAHLHENGVCPYEVTITAPAEPTEPEPQKEEPTTPTITTSNIETTKKTEIDLNGIKQAAYQEGYKKGTNDTHEEYKSKYQSEQDTIIMLKSVSFVMFFLIIILGYKLLKK